ncbi:MAG: putative sugar nucleotidyl transferase [bacterium]|jgi:UDP-N-acetylglucosamine diphosphorylase/glucosamine-1-phosphate N-acetyltransferase|nr:putative sugar nucleotidyl transferase [bacterium]
MKRQILFFEDEGVTNFYPLTLNRPVYDLRCGIRPLWEKGMGCYPSAEAAFHVRPYLAALLREQRPEVPVNGGFADRALLVNGRVLWNAALAQSIPIEGEDELFVCGETLVAARLSGEALAKVDWSTFISRSVFGSVKTTTVQAEVITYVWDLVYANPAQIGADCAFLGCHGAKEGLVDPGVYFLSPENITLAPGARLKPGVVIDAEKGPVFIDEGAQIYPHAVIEGPCYVGKQSWVMVSAKIYEGVSIGECCKIGGEVEESIIHSFSNKRHDGFLGHSYLGQWVNLGADTNNSNLKNNYGTVDCYVNGEPVSTGRMFMGLTVGDHSKAGINTMFNTGTVMGFSCNIFGTNFPPKYIPSFAWGGEEGFVDYRFSRALVSARRCLARRQLEINETEAAVFQHIFEMTVSERERFF